MERHVTSTIAAQIKGAMNELDQTLDYIAQNVEFSERAPLTRAIGEIFTIVTDEVYARLVKADPELHDLLFGHLPADAPNKFLKMSQLMRSAGCKD